MGAATGVGDRVWPESIAITPLRSPVDAVVVPPGSKSETNRVLLLAGLATGTSTLAGVLDSDDTQAMLSALAALGIAVEHDVDEAVVCIEGSAGRLPEGPIEVQARQSGTTARFLLPALCTGPGPYVLDAAPQMRARPMGDLVSALRHLGADVRNDRPPFDIRGGGVDGGRVDVAGDVSSQFLSGLLLSAPLYRLGLDAHVDGVLVSRPYVDMTIAVMGRFGAPVHVAGAGSAYQCGRGEYRATAYVVEPDASAASYLFAAAAISGGRIEVPGLGTTSVQGDLRFVELLGAMGCDVDMNEERTVVTGGSGLAGIDVDMADCSDTVPTLAVVAAFASSPTRIRGIGFIRNKESDRIGAVVAELRRCGITAVEEDDGLVVHPGAMRPATVSTYEDHRIAMAFSLLGLRVPGIVIDDPACVAKTFPAFFEVLDALHRPGGSR
jgi:3-phosphoshikimate 1-carboxyvinyltransferase